MGTRRWALRAVIALGVPALLLSWTLVAVSAQGASPGPSGALPGDPARGAQLFSSSGCTSCHGASLEGGVGPRLNPIVTLPDTKTPLDPNYLINTITHGKSGVGGYGTMPAKGGNPSLTDQDIRDIAAYIIQVNEQKGPQALGPVELARSTVFWVSITIILLVIVTWLLARYNMRWVARRARNRGGS
ncbi:MAG TPA: cytochrome c [Candidatus Dormibacteraeota bacterium]|nr:cytochrome c [Candidatus Dormibacteraeota bacterium]